MSSILSTPLTLHGFDVANRIVMPPVATNRSSEGGTVTQELLDHYAARAADGSIGLITVEHTFITQQGKASARQLSTAHDSDIPGLTQLAHTIKQHGSHAIVQINHCGSAGSVKVTHEELVSASAGENTAPANKGPESARELTQDEIHEIVDLFAQAARRVKEAGFDGVEVHSAHGYLLNQFYSPLTNRRTDKYGAQTIESRTRIHQEVLDVVRDAVGPDFFVSVRLGGCDYTFGGSTVEDAAAASKIFEAHGADMISVSGGMCGYRAPKGWNGPGWFSGMSSAIKRTVQIPVLLTGGIQTAADARRFLQDGSCNLIGAARGLLKDPQWATKALADDAVWEEA